MAPPLSKVLLKKPSLGLAGSVLSTRVFVAVSASDTLPSEKVPPRLSLKNSPPPEVTWVVSPVKVNVKSPDQEVVPTVPFPYAAERVDNRLCPSTGSEQQRDAGGEHTACANRSRHYAISHSKAHRSSPAGPYPAHEPSDDNNAKIVPLLVTRRYSRSAVTRSESVKNFDASVGGGALEHATCRCATRHRRRHRPHRHAPPGADSGPRQRPHPPPRVRPDGNRKPRKLVATGCAGILMLNK